MDANDFINIGITDDWNGVSVDVFLPMLPGNGIALGGTGFPLASYTLLGSTNLTTWTAVSALRADTNGIFQYTNYPPPALQFYRAVWNE